MNKTRLIWGIICLLIAGGLAIANLRLPPENLMFTVGNQNMPWVPVVILGIVGIVLLATAWTGQEKVEEKPKIVEDPERAALNKRLETIAWGAFLILLGGFMFVPEDIIKGGWWSIGVGLIFLGLNAARYFNDLRMSGFTTFLGVISVMLSVGVPLACHCAVEELIHVLVNLGLTDGLHEVGSEFGDDGVHRIVDGSVHELLVVLPDHLSGLDNPLEPVFGPCFHVF